MRTWRARQESLLRETTEQAKKESILIREATDYFEPKCLQKCSIQDTHMYIKMNMYIMYIALLIYTEIYVYNKYDINIYLLVTICAHHHANEQAMNN